MGASRSTLHGARKSCKMSRVLERMPPSERRRASCDLGATLHHAASRGQSPTHCPAAGARWQRAGMRSDDRPEPCHRQPAFPAAAWARSRAAHARGQGQAPTARRAVARRLRRGPGPRLRARAPIRLPPSKRIDAPGGHRRPEPRNGARTPAAPRRHTSGAAEIGQQGAKARAPGLSKSPA